MRAANARVTVLPAPKPPRKLKPGSEAAIRDGCLCRKRGTGFHTGAWYALNDCPMHTQSDLDALGRHWKDGEAT